MSSSSSSNSGGFGIILFIIFLILKLTGVISWSWWWVTCPLWIGFAIGLICMFGGVFIIAALAGLCALFSRKK